MEQLIDKLKNPDKIYRSLPLWSWNDKLDTEALKWQINEMDKAGLGGYFMHARGGLQTEYLSKEWMNCVKTCIEEGNKTGMASWCYDENGWPSGFAGGIVTGMGDKYHVRHIEICEVGNEEDLSEDDLIGVYSLEESGQLLILTLEQAKVRLSKGNKLIKIINKSNPYYIDILNKDVVKAFIEATHEKYYENFKEDFGKGIPGFFTDEPQFSRELIPWSYVLPQEFEKKYGYDIVAMLPSLFIECKGYESFRYDYWALVCELYQVSYGKQVYDWCEEHNCKLTGHTIQEDSLLWQMYCCGGVMPFYEHMHTPGMDWLGRNIDSPMIPKQVSSVANQLDKKFVLSETFALCGWDVSFEELKWIAEWQFVNGVNLLCPHLEGYSLRGLRKRDYPPSLFYQQSWWEEYRMFNDYFARLSVLLTSGKNATSTLLLHPIKSAWIAYNHKNNEILDNLNQNFVWATEALAGLHVDHHYGDETIIGKYGKVEQDKFIIGKCEYKTIIMPSMITIDEKTLELLLLFLDNGGKILSVGDLPKYCEGKSNSKIEYLKEKVMCIGESNKALYEYLKEIQLDTISISDQNGEIDCIHYQQRDMGNTQVFYMVNHDQNNTFEAEITIKGKGQVKKYLVESSKVENIAYVHESDNTKFKLKFLPMQSYVVFYENNVDETVEIKELNVRKIELKKQWEIDSVDFNSLTLDYCCYCVGGGEWSEPTPIIKLMDTLLSLKRSCNVAMKFNFNINMDLCKNQEMFTIIESAAEFQIFINGIEVKYIDCGWWKDSSFKKVNIKAFVRNGSNEIILKRNFYQSSKVYDMIFGENILESEINKLTYDVELESIYIVGDFLVSSQSKYTYGERKAVFTEGPFEIVEKCNRIKSGDFSQQGYSFFAGSMKLSQQIDVKKDDEERIVVDFNTLCAPMSKIYVNNVPLKCLCWQPYSVDITDYVKEGSNKLTLEIFASNRNLLGPHHNSGGEIHVVGPSSFGDEGGWSDKYCFVKLGV